MNSILRKNHDEAPALAKYRKGNFLILVALASVMAFSAKSLRAATLASWDIGLSGSSSSGTANATVTLGTGVSGASAITLTGSVVGTTSTGGWRWYDGASPANSLSTALSSGNYFSWNLTASSSYDLSINGLGVTTFSRGSTAPNTLALLYSTDSAFGSYRTISSSVSIASGGGVADYSSSLAGDLGTTAITLGAGSTGYFRLAYWGASSTTSGTIWYGTNSVGNDFSILGTATALNVVRDLLWNGGNGKWGNGEAGWSEGGQNYNFSTDSSATINAAATLTVTNAGITAGKVSVTHASGDVILQGGMLTGTYLDKNGAGNLVFSNKAVFTGGATNSAGSTTMKDSLTISSGGLTVSSGSMVLEASNSITGGVSVSGGANVVAKNTNSLGTGILTLNNGKLSAETNLANAISLGASGGTISNAVAVTLGGTVSTNSIFTKEGVGKLTLTNTFASAGNATALNVNEGEVVLTGANKYITNSMINGTLTLDGVNITTRGTTLGGTGKIAVTNSVLWSNTTAATVINNSVDLASGSTLTVTNTGASTRYRYDFNGGLQGSGNFTLAGGGSGNTEVRLSGVSSNTGILTLGDNTYVRLINAAATNMNFIHNGASLLFSNSSASGAKTYNGTISGSGAVTTDGSGEQTFGGNITAGGAFSMGSSGLVTLLGQNTFNGLNISGSGGVNIGRSNSLGSGIISNSVSSGLVKIDGSAGTGNDWTLANSVVAGVSASDVMAFAPGTGNTLRLGGLISGAGQLKVSSGGDLYVNNTGNTYTGGTEVGTGRIIVSNAGALSTGTINFGTTDNSHLVATSAMQIANAITIGSSSSAGYTANLDTGANAVTISSVIANRAGNTFGGNLDKMGSGTLTLSGTNTYTGTTDIQAGTLVVNGSIASSSLTTVESGATLKGSGFVGALEIASGGTLAVGNSPGTLTASSAKWNGGGIYSWELASALGNDSSFLAGQGSQWDFLNVTGVLDITATSGNQFIIDIVNLLALNDTSFSENNNYSFAIATAVGGITNFDSSDFNITGYLSGSNKWSLGVVNNTGSSQTLLLSYTGATAIPEPATGSLVLWAGMVVLGVRRLRRSRV